MFLYQWGRLARHPVPELICLFKLLFPSFLKSAKFRIPAWENTRILVVIKMGNPVQSRKGEKRLEGKGKKGGRGGNLGSMIASLRVASRTLRTRPFFSTTEVLHSHVGCK